MQVRLAVKLLQIGDLCFEGDLEICVSNYSTAALTAAEHTDELVADGKTNMAECCMA